MSMYHTDKIYKTKRREGRLAVLAIDDVYLNLLLVKKTIGDMVNLYTVNTAKDAIKTLNLIKIDLLLLDLAMPEMDGFEFMEKLRAMPAYEKVPVIIISSDAKLNTFKKTLQYGIVDYISKPFDPDMLRKKVIKAVNHYV